MPKQDTKSSSASPYAKKLLFIILKSLKWTFIIGVIAAFFGGGIAAGYVTSLVKDDPVRDLQLITKKMEENNTTGFVYFNDDTLVGQLRTDEDRRLAKSDEVTQRLKDAFISIEDNNFEHHLGIDFKGLFRAVKEKLLHEERQTGGSTITQQLARRVFLSLDQTDARKAKEIFLSLRLERMMSKDEILLAYLNKIPFGNGSTGYNLYGIKAAAKGIFDKDQLSDLNIAQCAYLAGLPKAPSDYTAYTSRGKFNPAGFKLAKERQEFVLLRMLEENAISKQEYDEAIAFDLEGSLAEPQEKAYTIYPYLMLEAEQKAADILLLLQNPKWTEEDLHKAENAELIKDAREQMNRSGYKIYTTIDQTLYDMMQEIAHNKDNFTPDDPEKGIEQIGAIMIDNKTGAILSMMEGRDFYKEQLNHATQMLRQPGSTMKPIAAFIPALESGKIQPGTAIDDSPTILQDGVKGFHIPENWDNKFHGFITARRALNQSYNVPAIKIFNDMVGIDNAWEFARKLGITSISENDHHHRTGVIGGLDYGVSVEELTNAYAAMGNQGVFNNAYMIRKIVDEEGNVVYEHQPQPAQVFSEETAYLINDMMRTVITSGTATDIMRKFKYYGKIPVVGKTGSTQNDFDAWFEGLTPDITVGVWAGYDQPSTLTIGKGTLRAKNIWSLIMNGAVEKKPELFPTKKFEKPKNIVTMTVSDVSGKLPSKLALNSKHVVTDIFNKKFIPTEEDNMLAQMETIPFNKINYIPHPGTPSDFIQEKIVIKRTPSMQQVIEQIKQAFAKNPSSVPTKRGGARKTPNDYLPADAHLDAPSETDPRVEDGKAPSAPANVALTRKDTLITITFKPSPEADVIGYRLYRSLNGFDFKKVPGAIAYTGEDLKFTNFISLQNTYGYYVAAVDVSGNESAPSQLVFTNGSQANSILPPMGNVPSLEGNEQADQNSHAPATPTGLTISAQDGEAGVTLTWNANATGQTTGYNIYYSSTAAGPYNKIGTTKNTKFEYISIPANGWYQITAVNAVGESTPSAAVEFREN